ncbi:MAG: hypothetical protein ACFFE8_11570 [Candidatus Heimdallarchaeota archaeon]
MKGLEGACSIPDLGQIGDQPFNPYAIVSPQDNSILFYSQAFAQVGRFHPSTDPIPQSSFQRSHLELKQTKLNDCYNFLQCLNTVYRYRTNLIESIIHELRTASLAISLGAYAFALDEQVAPLILSRILQASHRQKISTLIASDIIQLITTPPITHPICLARILKGSLSHFPLLAQMNFTLGSMVKTDTIEHVNPAIWGNPGFLEHFFDTLFSWLEMEDVMVEMETVNPVTVKVCVRIPPDQFLPYIQGFRMISHYVEYVVAYFNGRSWVDQTSINILFPLCQNYWMNRPGRSSS